VTRPPQQGSLSGTANPIIAIAAVVVVLGIIAVIVALSFVVGSRGTKPS